MSRKRRRYGSPKGVHLKNAKEAVKAARFWMRESRKKIGQGECYEALRDLVSANRMSSQATSERRGAGHGKAMFQAGTLNSLMERFAKKCVR